MAIFADQTVGSGKIFAVQTGTTTVPVSADLTITYAIDGLVHADLQVVYAIQALATTNPANTSVAKFDGGSSTVVFAGGSHKVIFK